MAAHPADPAPALRTFPLAGSRRRDQLLLALLLLVVLGWDLYAVLLDRRLSGSDTYVIPLLQLRSALFGPGSLLHWLSHMGPKGPLPALVGLPLLIGVGEAVLAARLLAVLCHGLALLLCFGLGQTLSGRRDVGLWAALLCGTTPLIFGWSRLAYQEAPLAPLVLAFLGLCLALARTPAPLWRWALLGAVAGLGLLTKLSFPIFALWPALWLAATLWRRAAGRADLLRSGLGVALALGVMALVAAPWALPNAAEIAANFAMSSRSSLPAWVKARDYLLLPGVAPLLAAALVAGLWLLVAERRLRGEAVLLAGTVALAWVLLCGAFDPWSRYIVPALPPAALLAALGMDRVARRWPALPLARPLAALLVLVLLGPVLAWTTLDGPAGFHGLRNREEAGGLLSPVRRPHDGFPRAVRELRLRSPLVFVIHDSLQALHRAEGLALTWRGRGLSYEAGPLNNLGRELAEAGRLNVVLIQAPREGPGRGRPGWPIPDEDTGLVRDRDAWRWLLRQRRKELFLARDPDGLTYRALLVTPARAPTAPGETVREAAGPGAAQTPARRRQGRRGGAP